MADVTINGLSTITLASTLQLPASDGSATGKITIGDVNSLVTKTSLGLGDVENKSSATIRGEITTGNVTTALGYTPYNNTNPSGFITSSSLPTSNQLVKAWGVFNGLNNDLTNCSIFSSYNINRVYKRGNGRYTVYFQSALPSKNYAIAGTAQKYDSNDDGNIYVQAGGTTVNVNTTTEFYLNTVTNYASPNSSGIISFMVVGG